MGHPAEADGSRCSEAGNPTAAEVRDSPNLPAARALQTALVHGVGVQHERTEKDLLVVLQVVSSSSHHSLRCEAYHPCLDPD